MNKLAKAVSGWFNPREVHFLALVGIVLFMQALPTAAQTRMVNSEGEVIIIERPKPTQALRSRWIKPGEVAVITQPAAVVDEEEAEPQLLSTVFDVLGRNVQPTSVAIPLAPDVSVQPIPAKQSSRIEVLGRDEGDELLQLLANLLRDSGEQLVEFKIVETQVSADQVRYFHESDRSHAEYIAGLLDGVFDSLPVRNYSFYRPSPPEGVLEIWIQ